MALYPRRVTSTPTTVNVTGLPSWITDIPAGSWSNAVSANTVSSIATASGCFTANRSMDILFTDFTGAIWNPHYGTHGAWIFHGGGHSDITNRLDNGVYAWDAGTRAWKQLRAPTFPGTLSTSSPVVTVPLDYWLSGAGGTGKFIDGIPGSTITTENWATGDSNSSYPDPFASYGELEDNIPASHHSRWNLSIVPPGLGGGSSGSLVFPFGVGLHVGGNTRTDQGHIFDCATGTWARFGPRNPALSIYWRRWVSATDTTLGRVIQVQDGGIWWIDAANPIAWSANRAPSGFESSGFQNCPMAYCPEINAFVIVNSGFDFTVFTANELYTTGIPRFSLRPIARTGSPPPAAPPESKGLTWCADLGSNGAFVCLDYHAPYAVYACYAPSNPITEAWRWEVLSSSNSPNFNFTGFDDLGGEMYNRFQYAPALKSFFVTALASQNMWCFRPSEIL